MGRLYQLFGAFCVLAVFYYAWTACRGLKYRKGLIIVQLANLIFVLIGYKHLSMPMLTWFIMGAVGIPLIVYGIMYDSNVTLIIATTYLSYNLMLPGTFGGVQQALNATNIIMVALVAGLFIGKRDAAAAASRRNPAVILVILFLALSMLSFVQGGLFYKSGYFGAFFFPLKRWLTPFIVFYLFYKILPDRKVIKIIFAVAMITIIANIFFGLLQWVSIGFGMYSERKYRLGGFNLHPNFFGAFIAYYLPFFAGPLLLEYRKTAGRFLLFPVLLGLRVIIPVNSRGSWVALPPAFLTLGIFRSKILIPLVVLAVLLVFALPDVLIPQTVQDRFGAAIEIVPREDIYGQEHSSPGDFLSESRAISFRVRWILLEGGLKMIQESPWFGFGWGAFPYLIHNYTEFGISGSAHNMWLQIGCEMGLVGLSVLLAAFGLLFKMGIYVFRREQDPMLRGMALGLMGCIPAMFVNNFTGSRLDSVDLNIIMFIIAACTVKLQDIIKREKSLAARSMV